MQVACTAWSRTQTLVKSDACDPRLDVDLGLAPDLRANVDFDKSLLR